MEPDERLEALLPVMATMHACEPEAMTLIANEIERLREALETIASLKPRPALDPWNCEERLKRIARDALGQ